MGSHLTLFKNSGNIRPPSPPTSMSHSYTHTDKNLPFPVVVPLLKLSHSLSSPSLSHFEPLLHH